MGVIVITRNFIKSNEPKAPDDDVNTFSHPVPRLHDQCGIMFLRDYGIIHIILVLTRDENKYIDYH